MTYFIAFLIYLLRLLTINYLFVLDLNIIKMKIFCCISFNFMIDCYFRQVEYLLIDDEILLVNCYKYIFLNRPKLCHEHDY